MYLQLVTLLCAAQLSVAVSKIHTVYWNKSNPIFRIDNTRHIVDVGEYDQLHLICPTNTEEQHVIYSVTEEEFRSCRVTNPKPKRVAICNKAEEFQRFTITFRSFSPTPGGMEFKPGQDYYFISTSTRRDLHRRVGGFCSSHNMKMKFRVAERETDYKAGMPSTSSTRRPIITTTPFSVSRSVPTYYYGSRTPSVSRSDYIYYYSPRDLIQLKAAAKRHGVTQRQRQRQINTENNLSVQAAPLTAGQAGQRVVGCVLLTLATLLTILL